VITIFDNIYLITYLQNHLNNKRIKQENSIFDEDNLHLSGKDNLTFKNLIFLLKNNMFFSLVCSLLFNRLTVLDFLNFKIHPLFFTVICGPMNNFIG
jgi:hypothetical protein